MPPGESGQGADPDPSAFQDEGWTVSPDPAVVMGGPDEREGYLLQRVADATRLSDGPIVIADGGSAEISFTGFPTWPSSVQSFHGTNHAAPLY